MLGAKNSVNKSLKTLTLKQGCMLPGTPHQVYELLMDSKKHASFTGGEAQISRQVGGEFTTFDGWASGKNVEFVPDERIVQTWRADDWPTEHYSTITIKLLKAPRATSGERSRTKSRGTKLLFTQTDVPASHAKSIAQGWKDYYWQPMKSLLEKQVS
jgi:activator of HSP90 ATPase